MEDQILLEEQTLQTKRTFRRIGYTLFMTLLVVSVVQYLLLLLLNKISPGIQESSWYIAVLLVPFYFIGFPLFLWRMKKLPDGAKGEAKKMSFIQLLVIFIVCMGGAYLSNIVSVIINLFIFFIKGFPVVNPLETIIGLSSLLPIIIFVGIISPIIEEIMFRGVLLDKLRGYGDKTAIFFTALAFGLFHGNLSQFFYAFALGLFFGYIAIRTNRIRYTIILHIVINILGSVVMPFLALSGNLLLVLIPALFVLVFIVLGIILFIVNYKKIELYPGEKDLNTKNSRKAAYWNLGMIFYYLLCLVSFVSVIIA